MRKAIAACALLCLVSCGGGGGNSTPTTPTPTTPTQANRAPVINSISITPAFGIAQVTVFAFSATASDPDGDATSFAWTVGGVPFSTASGSVTFSTGGSGVANLTVTDGKGGSVSDSRSCIVGTMAGTWAGTLSGASISVTLAQPAGGLITGTWAIPSIGITGNLDPATVNKIDAGGNVTMRFKVQQGSFNDFIVTGTMDQTGARFVGVANGSGFSGTPIVWTK